MKLEPDSIYSEAGNMLRHFSNIRAAICSFLIPSCFVIIGWALLNFDYISLQVYLLIAEIVLYLCMTYCSVYFSSRIYFLSRVLIAIEGGKETITVYNRLDRFRIARHFYIDAFDKIIIFSGLLVHLILYTYILISHIYKMGGSA